MQQNMLDLEESKEKFTFVSAAEYKIAFKILLGRTVEAKIEESIAR